MTLRPLLATAIFALAACAAPGPHTRDIPGDITFLADGSRAYSITCNGGFDSFTDCIQRAGQICQSTGYKVVSSYNVFYDWHRAEIVKCKTPSGLFPGDENIPPAD